MMRFNHPCIQNIEIMKYEHSVIKNILEKIMILGIIIGFSSVMVRNKQQTNIMIVSLLVAHIIIVLLTEYPRIGTELI